MKKIILGITLIIGGITGILALILAVIPISQTSVFAYFKWYGIMPVFYGFVLMSIGGIIICIIDAYFNKGSLNANIGTHER